MTSLAGTPLPRSHKLNVVHKLGTKIITFKSWGPKWFNVCGMDHFQKMIIVEGQKT